MRKHLLLMERVTRLVCVAVREWTATNELPGPYPAGNSPPDCCIYMVRASYRIKKEADAYASASYGAGDEARTRYLHLGKVALYRMSYTRISRNKRHYSTQFKFVNSFFAFFEKRTQTLLGLGVLLGKGSIFAWNDLII